jgi:hypothetical protein
MYKLILVLLALVFVAESAVKHGVDPFSGVFYSNNQKYQSDGITKINTCLKQYLPKNQKHFDGVHFSLETIKNIAALKELQDAFAKCDIIFTDPATAQAITSDPKWTNVDLHVVVMSYNSIQPVKAATPPPPKH